MEQQGGLFGFFEKYFMGPMVKIAQYKIVRAITAAGMGGSTIYHCWLNVFSI